MSSKFKVQSDQCQNKSGSHASCVCIVGSCVYDYENQKRSKAFRAECSTPITVLYDECFFFFKYIYI